MEKKVFLAAALLVSAFLAACGAKEEAPITWQGVEPGMDDLTAVTDRTEYYDLTVEVEELFRLGLWEQNPQGQSIETVMLTGRVGYLPIGTQFFMGEPVQLWAASSSDGLDVWLYGENGTGELLLQDAPSSYIKPGTSGYRWYVDREGDFYCYRTIATNVVTGAGPSGVIAKISPLGELLYETALDMGIDDLCQMEDGRIYVLLKEASLEPRTLAEVNQDTGEIIKESQIEIPYTYDVYLGCAGNSPVVTGYALENINRKIMKVDADDGSLVPVLYLTGTSYGWHIDSVLQDVQVLEDGQIELLWSDFNGLGCFWERLCMEKVEKTPIVVRGVFYNDAWLAQRAALFNSISKDYHVIIEDCGHGNDVEDFARLTSVQVGAGKGPDILCGDRLLHDYISGMLEKGVLEELNQYMEESGILEEDYFPLVFSTWRQGEHIYSVTPRMKLSGREINEEVLGSSEIPDIETLADALLAREGNGLYSSGLDSGAVLESFLQGTDSLWGMIDWESGSCDFNMPLFQKLLEAARRYGDDGRKNLEASITQERKFYSFFLFKGSAEQEEAGVVSSGVLFDDGCYAASASDYTMAVNANSSNKEGAWEFICFLIGEETQDAADLTFNSPPVHREVFEKWLQEYIETQHSIKYMYGIPYEPQFYYADATEEKQEEYRKALEEARPLPIRTAPILTIILEEAEDYFNGYKNAEEVSRVVNNRVQLYLDEM